MWVCKKCEAGNERHDDYCVVCEEKKPVSLTEPEWIEAIACDEPIIKNVSKKKLGIEYLKYLVYTIIPIVVLSQIFKSNDGEFVPLQQTAESEKIVEPTITKTNKCFYIKSQKASIRSGIEVSTDNIMYKPKLHEKFCATEKWIPPTNSNFKNPWYKVNLDNRVGWISETALSEYPRVTSDCNNTTKLNIYLVTANHGLNVRRTPSGGNNIIGVIIKNNKACAINENKYWIKVRLTNNQVGWLHKKYLINPSSV